jgi:hypothetical protein
LALEADCVGFEDGEDQDEALCGVFLDCSKCYERVPLRQLDERAARAEFPDRLLVLALSMYSGRRHVRVGLAVARPVVAASGIMAGCGLAVSLLRAHLREAVVAAREAAEAEGGGAPGAAGGVRRYVDDWVVWVRAPAAAAARGARGIYDRLVGRLEEAGMQLNLLKTGVVASSAAGLAAARAAFAGSGAPVVPSVRDLGVDVCWGAAAAADEASEGGQGQAAVPQGRPAPGWGGVQKPGRGRDDGCRSGMGRFRGRAHGGRGEDPAVGGA